MNSAPDAPPFGSKIRARTSPGTESVHATTKRPSASAPITGPDNVVVVASFTWNSPPTGVPFASKMRAAISSSNSKATTKPPPASAAILGLSSTAPAASGTVNAAVAGDPSELSMRASTSPKPLSRVSSNQETTKRPSASAVTAGCCAWPLCPLTTNSLPALPSAANRRPRTCCVGPAMSFQVTTNPPPVSPAAIGLNWLLAVSAGMRKSLPSGSPSASTSRARMSKLLPIAGDDETSVGQGRDGRIKFTCLRR